MEIVSVDLLFPSNYCIHRHLKIHYKKLEAFFIRP